MGYEIAINKAWEELLNLNPPESLKIKFLADEYSLDIAAKKIFSLSCNTPAKDFVAILLLHYLAQKLKGLPEPTGEWVSFKELSAIEGYAEAFRKRTIEPIIRKYGKNPAGVFAVLERLPAKKAAQADAAIVVEAFSAVPLLVELWRGDEEFGPEANILFDRSISRIFCTEDIVVLAQFVAASL